MNAHSATFWARGRTWHFGGVGQTSVTPFGQGVPAGPLAIFFWESDGLLARDMLAGNWSLGVRVMPLWGS